VFYDNWVARDINGTALENAPFEGVFHHPDSSVRFQRHLPVQVQSCWNGIAVLDPAPIYATPHVRFRMARLAEGECSASECSLIGNDYWSAGYGRIIMVPRVKLAYDKVRHVECNGLNIERWGGRCRLLSCRGRPGALFGVYSLRKHEGHPKDQCRTICCAGDGARTCSCWAWFSRAVTWTSERRTN
jgi:Cryptococcal mannosyltransferase 1